MSPLDLEVCTPSHEFMNVVFFLSLLYHLAYFNLKVWGHNRQSMGSCPFSTSLALMVENNREPRNGVLELIDPRGEGCDVQMI